MKAGDIGNIITLLSKMVTTGRTVLTDIVPKAKEETSFTKIVFGSSSPAAENISELLQKASVRPLRPYIHELRCTKSDAEIAVMRKAGKASGTAFTEAMSQRFATEKDLDTFLDYRFKSWGCDESAYVPVVGGGKVSRFDQAYLEQHAEESRMLCKYTMSRTTQSSSESVLRIGYTCHLLCTRDGDLVCVDAGGVRWTSQMSILPLTIV